jgi:ATP-dependent DNA helicase RecG
MINWDHMHLAVRLAMKTVFEDPRPHPKVGAVLVNRLDDIVATSHRGQFGRGDHAEYLVLEKALEAGVGLSDCMIYSTLEPCISRGHQKIPCATRIVNAGIRTVAIGMVDPNPRMSGRGIFELQSNGVTVHMAPPDIFHELLVLNSEFVRQFAISA